MLPQPSETAMASVTQAGIAGAQDLVQTGKQVFQFGQQMMQNEASAYVLENSTAVQAKYNKAYIDASMSGDTAATERIGQEFTSELNARLARAPSSMAKKALEERMAGYGLNLSTKLHASDIKNRMAMTGIQYDNAIAASAIDVRNDPSLFEERLADLVTGIDGAGINAIDAERKKTAALDQLIKAKVMGVVEQAAAAGRTDIREVVKKDRNFQQALDSGAISLAEFEALLNGADVQSRAVQAQQQAVINAQFVGVTDFVDDTVKLLDAGQINSPELQGLGNAVGQLQAAMRSGSKSIQKKAQKAYTRLVEAQKRASLRQGLGLAPTVELDNLVGSLESRNDLNAEQLDLLAIGRKVQADRDAAVKAGDAIKYGLRAGILPESSVPASLDLSKDLDPKELQQRSVAASMMSQHLGVSGVSALTPEETAQISSASGKMSTDEQVRMFYQLKENTGEHFLPTVQAIAKDNASALAVASTFGINTSPDAVRKIVQGSKKLADPVVRKRMGSTKVAAALDPMIRQAFPGQESQVQAMREGVLAYIAAEGEASGTLEEYADDLSKVEKAAKNAVGLIEFRGRMTIAPKAGVDGDGIETFLSRLNKDGARRLLSGKAYNPSSSFGLYGDDNIVEVLQDDSTTLIPAGSAPGKYYIMHNGGIVLGAEKDPLGERYAPGSPVILDLGKGM